MGIKKNNVIYGTVGTIVCYQLRGKEVVRSLPGKVRQSRATKASAKDFGKIKKISRYLRVNLKSVLPSYKSMPLMFAVDAAVRRWYHDFYRNRQQESFDPGIFNTLELKPGMTSSVKELLGVEPVVIWSENRVELQFPAMAKSDLTQIDGGVTAISFCVKISGAMILPNGDIPNSVRGTSYSIDKPIDENGIDAFSVVIDKSQHKFQGLFVAYLSLRYQLYHQWRDEDDMKPVVVVGSWFNGERPEEEVKKDADEDEE